MSEDPVTLKAIMEQVKRNNELLEKLVSEKAAEDKKSKEFFKKSSQSDG